MQQSIDYARQSAQKSSAIQRLNQGLLRLHLNLGRELIKAPSVMRRQITLEASKAESVIASAAYPVFRLPKAAAFDAKAGTRRMMRGVSEQLPSRRGGDRWIFRIVAKKDPEIGANRTETGCRRNRKVDLKTSLQQ